MTTTAEQIKVFSITNYEGVKIFYSDKEKKFYSLSEENAKAFFGETVSFFDKPDADEPVTIAKPSNNYEGGFQALLAFPLIIDWKSIIHKGITFKLANGVKAIHIARYIKDNSFGGWGVENTWVAIDCNYQLIDLTTYSDDNEAKNLHLDRWAEKLSAV